MYEEFYGLKEKPFNLLPDPDYLYMSDGHENAYTHLEYAIAENKGFVVVTGEIGSGKTTLINYLLSKIPDDIEIGLINNTYIPPNQIIKSICREFELEINGKDKAELMDAFHEFLIDRYSKKQRVVLIIDEAQNLAKKALEEIRMLSNLEAEKHHLIQIILVGQPELKYRLQHKRLEQIVQRITVHCHINGLKRQEVDNYIKYRLTIGGAENPEMFNEEAVNLIAKYSRGIPRIINLVCDAALVYGYADNKKIIDKKIVEDVIRERGSGGIFTDAVGEEKKDADLLSYDDKDVGDALERINILEVRLNNLETLFKSIDQRLNYLMTTREERDAIVLELFKMLKSSMHERYETLLKIKKII